MNIQFGHMMAVPGPIGSVTPSSGVFTQLNASVIDGAIIGSSTPKAGSFTELTAATYTITMVADSTLNGTPKLLKFKESGSTVIYYVRGYPGTT